MKTHHEIICVLSETEPRPLRVIRADIHSRFGPVSERELNRSLRGLRRSGAIRMRRMIDGAPKAGWVLMFPGARP